jgi:hypothetical protein
MQAEKMIAAHVTSAIDFNFTHQNLRQLTCHAFPNMSGRSMCKDKRIKAAVDLLMAVSVLPVPQAMKAADFMKEESANQLLQIQVHQKLDKRRGSISNNETSAFQMPLAVLVSGTLVTAFHRLYNRE